MCQLHSLCHPFPRHRGGSRLAWQGELASDWWAWFQPRYCAPQGPSLPFLFSDCCLGSGAHLLCLARQPAKAPGGHINYIAAPPLFSHVYLWVCLLSQPMPSWSLSISTAVYSYLLCVNGVCGFMPMFSNLSSQMRKCTCIHAHTLLLPLSGRS